MAESASTPEYHSPVARIARFVRDFLPAQYLQLLFPLGSVLLLIGASSGWYRLNLPGVFEAMQQWRSLIDPNTFARFTHYITDWVSIEEQIARVFAVFASIASLVLWCLSLRDVIRKFIVWVFLPAGFALVAFQAFLLATTRQRDAAFNAITIAAHVPLPATRPWFPTLGEGIFFTLSGLIVFAVALQLVRRQIVSLPLRFRDTADEKGPSLQESSRSSKDIFAFMIGTTICTLVVSLGIDSWLLLENDKSWNSHSFIALQWAPYLVDAIAAAVIAFQILRIEKLGVINRLFARRPVREYLVALAIPFACILLPRFFLGVASQPFIDLYEWNRFFIPHPLPWVLIVFVIAFFEEFAIRGYLQTALESHFSLNRSIFLTGILWALLLGFGMSQSLPHTALAHFPGVSLIARFATLVIYSVPLGWLYARTRSVIATTLMHGTIVIFHVGVGMGVHLDYPWFYWTELALWVFVGWLLFRKYPPIRSDAHV